MICAVRQHFAKSIHLACILLVSLGCDGATSLREQQRSRSESVDVDIPSFAEEVQLVLRAKIGQLEELATDQVLIQSVEASNRQTLKLSQEHISRLDARWSQAVEITDQIQPFLVNPCAKRLLAFQRAHPGYPEVFVTDQRGLIVGETNPTSDFYQADEMWWQKAYDEGRGRAYYGEIEFDASAHSEAISLYVPVWNTTTGEAIGIIKAVCDVAAIKADL